METIYMIGNAHLDPVWLWTKLEGYNEIISTAESAARRIEEDGAFIFTFSSAAYYDVIRRVSPSLFEKIKNYVRLGKWSVVGGWWVQPDNNLASGEIYARHALYSQRFFYEHFGIMCKTGYCVDSFGHNANLPQLLREGGMENYVFMRPKKHENASLPSLFRWKAPGGAEVLTYKITDQDYNAVGLVLSECVDNYLRISKETGHDMMCFYGVGNHGGGPTRKNLAEINGMIAAGKPVKFGSTDEYFKKIRAGNAILPEVSGPLHHHAIGCYSVCGRIKSAQRKAEYELQSAESYALMATELLGRRFEGGRFKEAYLTVLFNTFHDIICGCSLKKGMDEALEAYHASITAARTLKEEAMIALAKNIDTMVDGVTHSTKTDWQIWEEDNLGVPLVVFNHNSFETERHIAVERMFGTCADDTGKPLALQYITGNFMNGPEDKATLLKVKVKPFGYTTYWLYKDKKIKAPAAGKAIARGLELENQYIIVSFDAESGGVISLYDKKTGKELLGGASFVPRIFDDKTNTWSHNIEKFPSGKPKKIKLNKISVTENGDCLGEVTVKYEYRKTAIKLAYRLYEGDAFLTVSAKINYSVNSSIMRFAAMLARSADRALFEMPFGFFEKAATGDETPGFRYAAAGGLALVTENKSSFKAEKNELSFIAVRNSMYAFYGAGQNGKDERGYTDEGLSEFSFAVVPFTEGNGHASLIKIAGGLREPDYLIDTYHAGPLQRVYSGMGVDAENIVLSAAKKGEDGGVVFRMYEASQQETHCIFTYKDMKTELFFKKNEVKTLLLKENGIFCEADFMEFEKKE